MRITDDRSYGYPVLLGRTPEWRMVVDAHGLRYWEARDRTATGIGRDGSVQLLVLREHFALLPEYVQVAKYAR